MRDFRPIPGASVARIRGNPVRFSRRRTAFSAKHSPSRTGAPASPAGDIARSAETIPHRRWHDPESALTGCPVQSAGGPSIARKPVAMRISKASRYPARGHVRRPLDLDLALVCGYARGPPCGCWDAIVSVILALLIIPLRWRCSAPLAPLPAAVIDGFDLCQCAQVRSTLVRNRKPSTGDASRRSDRVRAGNVRGVRLTTGPCNRPPFDMSLVALRCMARSSVSTPLRSYCRRRYSSRPASAP